MDNKMVNVLNSLDEILSTHFPQAQNKVFNYSKIYQVFAGEKSGEAIPHVFGKSRLWRLKLHYKNIRKKTSCPSIKTKLPEDAIIFYREDKEGVIAVSHEQNFIIKMFMDKSHLPLIEREILALRKIKGSAFEEFSSSYIDDGVTSDGARWVMTDFRSNSDSLKNHLDFEKNWLDISYQEIMPRMSRFYQINDHKFISRQTWIDQTLPRVETHPESIFLKKALEHISDDDSAIILESIVHFDLHTGNVLHSDGHYSIIDWEGSFKAPVVIDAFDFMRRYLQKNQRAYKQFDQISHDVFSQYQEWVLKYFKQEIPSVSYWDHFLIYAIERALFFWETAKINRFNDKRSIEKFILSKTKE